MGKKRSKSKSIKKMKDGMFAFAEPPKGPMVSEIRRLTFTTTLVASTAAGNFASVGSNGISACTEWTAYSARWQEYRVLSLRLNFRSRFPQSPWYSASTPTADAPVGQLMIADDRDGIAANPTNMAGLWAWSNVRLISGNSDTNHVYKALDLEDQLWNSTAATIPQEWRVVYGVSNPANPLITNTIVYDIYAEYAVQFRGPQ